jgi:hypothetical protein
MAHLGLHEIDLEVREVALAEEVESGLRRPDGRDLLAELDEAHARVRGAADDRATEAKRLSRQLARVAKSSSTWTYLLSTTSPSFHRWLGMPSCWSP